MHALASFSTLYSRSTSEKKSTRMFFFISHTRYKLNVCMSVRVGIFFIRFLILKFFL